jgi:import inner membrane translocase subunit TIM23
VPTTIASLVASASYFGNLEADPTQTIFGVEPIFAYIGAT